MATEISIDRAEWDNAWRNLPLRRLVNRIQVDVAPTPDADWGEPTHVDVVADPPQYADRGWRPDDVCPVCGRGTSADSSRLAVTLFPYFASGFSYGRPSWAHQSCFDSCEEVAGQSPVPW
jgi:hypothetical protein